MENPPCPSRWRSVAIYSYAANKTRWRLTDARDATGEPDTHASERVKFSMMEMKSDDG